MHDVIVIGAGFAGCSAAREVRRAGKNPLILEARDRIGGRTWTSDWDGRRFERGGNFFHWFQPHVWSEIVASGCTVKALPHADRAYWLVDGELHSGELTEREAIAERAWGKFNENSKEILPFPHQPLAFPEQIRRLDNMTIEEHIDEIGLTGAERAVMIGEGEGVASGHLDDAGALVVVRWHALSGHTLPGTQEACGHITVAEGTIAFLQPILDEAACELRLNTPVAAIEQHDDHVVVTTRDGEALAARAVVVTIPLNVLHDVTFDPPLSETKQGGITLGQAGIGSKLMLRVKGHSNSINALADEHPFSYIGTLFDDVADDEQVLACFGHDGDEIHADDLGWAQRELDRLVPGLTVLEINFHDWKADEFSQGTWAAHRPGWYTNYHAEMQRPEGRIILANSDFADGWAGFVDGALESGKRGGRWAAAHC